MKIQYNEAFHLAKKKCNVAFQEIAMRCWAFPWLVNYSIAQFCVRLTTIGPKFWAILELGTWFQKLGACLVHAIQNLILYSNPKNRGSHMKKICLVH